MLLSEELTLASDWCLVGRCSCNNVQKEGMGGP